MQHDQQLRAEVRAIYEACYPDDEWAPESFEEAERTEALHYRQALDAALQARRAFADTSEQLPLLLEAA